MNRDTTPGGFSPPPTAWAALPNPFARPVIDGPRDVLATAESIHRSELAHIVAAFGQLGNQPVPRLLPGPLAMLVLSQMPGSGKSHLLGRLWRALNGRAMVVFLRAQQDKEAFWRRILERLVQELEYPEATDQRVLQLDAPTQLDSLARHLLAELLEAGLRTGQLKTSPHIGRWVRSGEPQAIKKIREKMPELLLWLNKLVPLWHQQLSAAGLRLERNAVAWLNVLVSYTLHTPQEPQRSLALSWLQGNELEAAEAQLLGLTASQCRVELPATERSQASLNESAFLCIKDLCALSAFFRPVVFAFDQTEVYGQDPELAYAFGATLGRLQAECINQFTVVTGNEQPWLHRVSEHFEQADRDRFDPRLRLVIKGIDQAQAVELVEVKLRSVGYPAEAIGAFVAQPWLAQLFASRAARPLPRSIEQAACLALAQWQTGAVPVPPEPTPWPVQDPMAMLTQAMAAHRQRLLDAPKQLHFDLGVLAWVLGEGMSRVPGLAVREVFAPPKCRMNIQWKVGSQVLLWVLDSSNQWKHWEGVANNYVRLAAHLRTQGASRVVGLAAWHHSLSPVGDGMRKRVDSAASEGFALWPLSDAQMADLYAAQAVYADVCQGDLSPVDVPTLLAFLGQHFERWVRGLFGAAAQPPPHGRALAPRVESLTVAPSPPLSPSPPSPPSPPVRPAPLSPVLPRVTAPRGNEAVCLTVSQLVCACARPGWLAQWQLGLNPSTRPQGGDGLPTHGARLHLVAQAFAQWATDPANAAAAEKLTPVADLFQHLLSLGGQALCQRLRSQGQPDAAAKAEHHLRQLARHFSQSRKACAEWGSWRDVFLAQEHPLSRVELARDGSRAVSVSGRLDSLRHALPHDVLLLDYKFTPADATKEARLQLAIYQRMLHLRHGIRANGRVVFLDDPIRTLSQSAEQLSALFDSRVQPVLDRLLAARAASPATPTAPVAPPAPAAPTTSPPAAAARPDVLLGVQRHQPCPPVGLPVSDLARHSVVLGSTGSGKTTAALHLIEQALERGIPAVLLDRKGDLCRYAQPAAWQDPAWPPEPHRDDARRQALHQRLDIRVYTPGAIQGRGLRLPLAPAGLFQLPDAERDVAAQESATAFAAALGLTRKTDESKKAVLVRVFQVLARRIEGCGVALDDVLTLLTNGDPDLNNAIGILDPKLCVRLAEQVETFKINSGTLMDERAEPLDWTHWFAPRPDGRLPLTIVSTKFLGDDSSILFWVAQFFLELLRHVSRHPSEQVQGLLMVDEADLYLPATKSPATKAPLESLLKRARSGGVGLLLCTQSPGDLDYRGRDNIRNWLLGSLREARALDKLSGLLADSRVGAEQLSKQRVGQFVFAAEGQATALNVPPNWVKTEQLSEPEILRVAKLSLR